ncbi:hypothetical protein IQ235_12675 [Oscillatoriales cyanobacterium LEGE 11467]|uniref:Uncharacterized protein n=1 Tax=Zarconia navalis LEGE 11467 TaxID=1828826 RepID=A0A928Z8I8_9CYAN|nr:hypothetical protein [Zarconia navalis]MBE9041635.1 hypothetical protein [Zarconia navalis LEGE 11467]
MKKARVDVLDSASPEIERLHRLTVYARWAIVSVLWMSLGLWSLWALRREIALWLEHFTWVAVWYALRAHPISGFGLFFCTGMTLSVLIWQSRNILWGLPKSEQLSLARQVRRIRETGPSHPLWKWVVRQ